MTNIIYVPTREGWLYVESVKDLDVRVAVSRYNSRMTRGFVLIEYWYERYARPKSPTSVQPTSFEP